MSRGDCEFLLRAVENPTFRDHTLRLIAHDALLSVLGLPEPTDPRPWEPDPEPGEGKG
jgi:hypothetical protein